MKRVLLFFLALVVVVSTMAPTFPVAASARLGESSAGKENPIASAPVPFTINDRYTVDNFQYKEIGYKKVQLTGVVDPSLIPADLVIPATITAGIPTQTFSVVEIAPRIFQDNLDIQTVVLPDSITAIGASAFENCTNFTRATLPSELQTIGDRVFAECGSLSYCPIPSKVTTIGYNAFADCSSLTEIILPNSVTTLGDAVFINCIGITTAVVSSGMTTIPTETFIGCDGLERIIIPDSIKTIDFRAFNLCNSLTTLTMPPNISFIGTDAFLSCNSLTRLEVSSQEIANLVQESGFTTLSKIFIMPANINPSPKPVIPPAIDFNFGDFTFEITGANTVTLTAYSGSDIILNIPPNVSYNGNTYTVTSIGEYAFYLNTTINKVVLPDTITTLKDSCFMATTELESINLPSSIKTIEGSAFYGCGKLNNVVVPDSVTSLGGGAFAGCYALTDIQLSNSLKTLEGGMFFMCNALTTITLPDSITVLESNVFTDCPTLSSVTLPANLQVIGYQAFTGCHSLLFLDLPESVNSIGLEAFEPTLQIHCQDPQGQLAVVSTHDFPSYPASNWHGNTSVAGGGLATLEQDVVINKPVIINEGAHITQPTGKVLTVNQSLQVDGILTSDDNITVYDTLTINGTLDGTGMILIMPGGEITGNYDPNRVIFSITVHNGISDKTTAKIGENINLTATIPTGEIFRSWIVNTGVINIQNPESTVTSFTMPAHTVEVTARSGKKFPLNVIATDGGSASASSSEPFAGDVVTITATTNEGYRFLNWEVLEGDLVLLPAANASANFVMPSDAVTLKARFELIKTDPSPEPQPEGKPSPESSGSDSAGSNMVDQKPVVSGIHWLTTQEVNIAIAVAKKNNLPYASTRRNDVTGIRLAQLKQLEQFEFMHSTTGSPVQVRVYIPFPQKIKQDILLSGSVKGTNVDNVKSTFEKWYKNKLHVVHLDQQTKWGQAVEIAAKVDLSGMDADQLYFYSYDSSTQTYKQITSPNNWVDKNGYLHFSTELAGDIVISEGKLSKKV